MERQRRQSARRWLCSMANNPSLREWQFGWPSRNPIRTQTYSPSTSRRCYPKTHHARIDWQRSPLNFSFYKLRIPRSNWSPAFLNGSFFLNSFLEWLCAVQRLDIYPWRAIPPKYQIRRFIVGFLLFAFFLFSRFHFACEGGFLSYFWMRFCKREKHAASRNTLKITIIEEMRLLIKGRGNTNLLWTLNYGSLAWEIVSLYFATFMRLRLLYSYVPYYWWLVGWGWWRGWVCNDLGLINDWDGWKWEWMDCGCALDDTHVTVENTKAFFAIWVSSWVIVEVTLQALTSQVTGIFQYLLAFQVSH